MVHLACASIFRSSIGPPRYTSFYPTRCAPVKPWHSASTRHQERWPAWCVCLGSVSSRATTIEAARIARLEDLKDRVRQACEAGEQEHAPIMKHFPQSLKLELTARCNLTCPHCSSHGTEELHRRHNQMSEMPVERLIRLADEVFPSLTSVGLVGRGEPLLVSNRLWNTLIQKLDEHHVLLTLVTNGTIVRRRITAEVMRRIETVHLSVDGGTESTFAINRRGSHLSQAIDALEYLNEIRRPLGLARRPRIGVTWTLKSNNVTELPEFIEHAIGIGIEQVTLRHLLVFHGHSRGDPVIDQPELANGPLRNL